MSQTNEIAPPKGGGKGQLLKGRGAGKKAKGLRSPARRNPPRLGVGAGKESHEDPSGPRAEDDRSAVETAAADASAQIEFGAGETESDSDYVTEAVGATRMPNDSLSELGEVFSVAAWSGYVGALLMIFNEAMSSLNEVYDTAFEDLAWGENPQNIVGLLKDISGGLSILEVSKDLEDKVTSTCNYLEGGGLTVDDIVKSRETIQSYVGEFIKVVESLPPSAEKFPKIREIIGNGPDGFRQCQTRFFRFVPKDPKKLTFAESAKEKKPVPAKKVGWGDVDSSDEDLQEVFDYVHKGAAESGDAGCIMLPGDIKGAWPKGYELLERAAKGLGLTIALHETIRFASGGFKYSTQLQDGEVGIAATKSLDVAEKQLLVLLKGTVAFTVLQPLDAATREGLSLPATFALQPFLFSGLDGKKAESISLCVKHKDGGKSAIFSKLSTAFSVNAAPLRLLLDGVERIHKSRAKNFREKKLMTPELHKAIKEVCYTSCEGIAKQFYVKNQVSTRVKVPSFKMVKGRKQETTTFETKVSVSITPPTLHVGSEFLLDKEKRVLKKLDRFFDVTQMVRFVDSEASEVSAEEKVPLIEKFVRDCYDAVAPISSAIRSRKNRIRASCEKGPDGRITSASFEKSKMDNLADFKEISVDVLGEIIDFIEEHVSLDHEFDRESIFEGY